MKTLPLTLATLLFASAGCTTNASRYHDQPLVSRVETGMNQAQVMQIGGPPLGQSARSEGPGTCFDYQFTRANEHQPYSVSFDAAGKVEQKSFMTCAQAGQAGQRSRERASSMGGMGGSGY